MGEGESFRTNCSRVHKRPPDKKLRELFHQAAGVPQKVADACGVNRSTVIRWLENPKIKAWQMEGREKLLDTAELGLARHVGEEAPWAIKFSLGTIGRARGFGQQVEVSGGLEVYSSALEEVWVQRQQEADKHTPEE